MAHMSTIPPAVVTNNNSRSPSSALGEKSQNNGMTPEGQSSSQQCSICYASPFENRTVVQSCLHAFCLECIQTWINEDKDTCPYCRGIMTEYHHSYDHRGNYKSEIVYPVVNDYESDWESDEGQAEDEGEPLTEERLQRALDHFQDELTRDARNAALRVREQERVIAEISAQVGGICTELLRHPDPPNPDQILERLARASQRLREAGVTRYLNGGVRGVAFEIESCIHLVLGRRNLQSRYLSTPQQQLFQTHSILPPYQSQSDGSAPSFTLIMRYQFARVAVQQILINTMQSILNGIRKHLLHLHFHPSDQQTRELIAEELEGIERQLLESGINRLEGGLTTRYIWAEIDELTLTTRQHPHVDRSAVAAASSVFEAFRSRYDSHRISSGNRSPNFPGNRNSL